VALNNEVKSKVKLLHHVLPAYFKTVFGFQLNLASKLPHLVEKVSLLLIENVPSFTKNILVLKGKVFQNSLSIFHFHKERNFNPFLNSTLFKLSL